MTSLSLPDGSNALWLVQAPNCLRLDPAFGGARITVELKACSRSSCSGTVSLTPTA